MLLPDRSHDVFACQSQDVIATTPAGCLRRCTSCGALHLRFGNIGMGLSPEDVLPFRQALERSRRQALTKARQNLDEPYVEISLGDSGIDLCFSLAEVREIDSLLAAIG